jgi:hypothetical protein
LLIEAGAYPVFDTLGEITFEALDRACLDH